MDVSTDQVEADITRMIERRHKAGQARCEEMLGETNVQGDNAA